MVFPGDSTNHPRDALMVRQDEVRRGRTGLFDVLVPRKSSGHLFGHHPWNWIKEVVASDFEHGIRRILAHKFRLGRIKYDETFG